jgi:hypothetical protein
MSWNDQVFRYCERGQDPTFWAEPLNAVSNVGFLVIAGLAARRLASETRCPGSGAAHGGPGRFALGMLIALAALIGVGSFLFHTFATRWSRLADVLPIGLFMVGYLGFALRAFLGWSWFRILAAVVAFLVVTGIAASISCSSAGPIGITTFAREPCLKGTMGYAPALIALLLVGALLHQQHPVSRQLLLAAGMFLAAMVLRWIDRDACPFTWLLGSPRGTHALWHLLNAATLHVLLGAAFAARLDGGRLKR